MDPSWVLWDSLTDGLFPLSGILFLKRFLQLGTRYSDKAIKDRTPSYVRWHRNILGHDRTLPRRDMRFSLRYAV